MRITRSILLFITLLGCAGHAAAVVSADWEPERLVLVFEPQNDNNKNAYRGLNDFSWQNTLSAEQLRAARKALIAKKKALLAKKKRQMAQKALMDAQRERVKPVAVQSVPESTLRGSCPDRLVANKVRGGGELASYFSGIRIFKSWLAISRNDPPP